MKKPTLRIKRHLMYEITDIKKDKMNILINTIKLNIGTYCDYHGLSLQKYAVKCDVYPNSLYKFIDSDRVMVTTFEKLCRPLGYYLENQGAEVNAAFNKLGWKDTLAMTGRQTAFIQKVIKGRKNVMLNKYVELIEGFGLDLKVRNNITEPLFAKLELSYNHKEIKAAEEKLEALEQQGIFDFNNEL